MFGHYLYKFIVSISPTWTNNFLTYLVVMVFIVSLGSVKELELNDLLNIEKLMPQFWVQNSRKNA